MRGKALDRRNIGVNQWKTIKKASKIRCLKFIESGLIIIRLIIFLILFLILTVALIYDNIYLITYV